MTVIVTYGTYGYTDDPVHRVELCETSRLKASEMVCRHRVAQLATQIARTGQWTHPIPIEGTTGLVMDGNHRLCVARRLRIQRIPVVLLSYEDRRVKVWDRRNEGPFDLSRLCQITGDGSVLPYKTTRHEFDPPLPLVAVDLALLM